jgi:hypothetical protein
VTTGADQRSPDRDDRGGANGGGGAAGRSAQGQGQGRGQGQGKPKPQGKAQGGKPQGKQQGGKPQGKAQGGKAQGGKQQGGKGQGGKPKQQAQGGKPKQGRGRHDPHRRDQPDETVAQLAGPLQRVLARLPETQRRVLELRMGLADGHPHDLADTARELGLSLGEAREIEQRAFEHIREAIPLQQLQRFLPR